MKKDLNHHQWLKAWLNPREWLLFLLGAIVVLEYRYNGWRAKNRVKARIEKETRGTSQK